MRLAHCSDLHLLSHDGARLLDYANKRWIGRMNLLTNRSRHHHPEAFDDMIADFAAQHIDHVLCTGDVTNLALEQEFRFARVRFDKIGLGPSHVTVIPGNHDTYVAEGEKHFAAVFPEFFMSDPPYVSDEPWPVVRVRGPVAIIGLSTSLQTPWFTAWGRVGDAQLARLEVVLADPRLADKARVVAIHHPPAGKRAASRIRGLKDRESFAAVLARAGAELVVHGHEHRDLSETLAGPDGAVIPVLGIQSGTYEANDPARTARYRVFEITEGAGRRAAISHHLRIWHRERRVFELDDQSPREVAASA